MKTVDEMMVNSTAFDVAKELEKERNMLKDSLKNILYIGGFPDTARSKINQSLKKVNEMSSKFIEDNSTTQD